MENTEDKHEDLLHFSPRNVQFFDSVEQSPDRLFVFLLVLFKEVGDWGFSLNHLLREHFRCERSFRVHVVQELLLLEFL